VTSKPERRRRRWQRKLSILMLLVCATAFFHGLLFRSAAEILVVEEPRTAAQAVLLLGGESRFDEAANLHADGAKVILLISGSHGRLERMGILPSPEDTTRRELLAREIPAEDLWFLSDEPVTTSTVGILLCDWLRLHPHWQVDVLCDRFSTRKWRLLLRRSADPHLVSRIHVIALPQRGFDESNWWHSKPGVRTIFNGYLRMGFSWWQDGPQPAGRVCTPADFESAFAR
jgi:hypothetical protein